MISEKKTFFFVMSIWVEILRLAHSFGLWGCWGLTNIVHFDKIRGFPRFQVTFQRVSTGKCSPLKSRGENVKQLQLLDNRFAALKTARKLFAKVIQCISNVIAVSNFLFFCVFDDFLRILVKNMKIRAKSIKNHQKPTNP